MTDVLRRLDDDRGGRSLCGVSFLSCIRLVAFRLRSARCIAQCGADWKTPQSRHHHAWRLQIPEASVEGRGRGLPDVSTVRGRLQRRSRPGRAGRSARGCGRNRRRRDLVRRSDDGAGDRAHEVRCRIELVDDRRQDARRRGHRRGLATDGHGGRRHGSRDRRRCGRDGDRRCRRDGRRRDTDRGGSGRIGDSRRRWRQRLRRLLPQERDRRQHDGRHRVHRTAAQAPPACRRVSRIGTISQPAVRRLRSVSGLTSGRKLGRSRDARPRPGLPGVGDPRWRAQAARVGSARSAVRGDGRRARTRDARLPWARQPHGDRAAAHTGPVGESREVDTLRLMAQQEVAVLRVDALERRSEGIGLLAPKGALFGSFETGGFDQPVKMTTADGLTTGRATSAGCGPSRWRTRAARPEPDADLSWQAESTSPGSSPRSGGDPGFAARMRRPPSRDPPENQRTDSTDEMFSAIPSLAPIHGPERAVEFLVMLRPPAFSCRCPYPESTDGQTQVSPSSTLRRRISCKGRVADPAASGPSRSTALGWHRWRRGELTVERHVIVHHSSSREPGLSGRPAGASIDSPTRDSLAARSCSSRHRKPVVHGR